MYKRIIPLILLAAVLAAAFSGCGKSEGVELTDAYAGENELTVESFKGKRFSITMGTGYEDLALEVFSADPDNMPFYDDGLGNLESVLKGIVDCTIVDLTCIVPILNQERYAPLGYYAIPEGICFDQYAAISATEEYVELFNAFLKTVKADGTFDDMVTRWVDEFDINNPPPMPDIPTSGENGILRVSTSSVCTPFVFLGPAGEIIGLEVELMQRFAASLGKTAQFTDMSYDALLLYIKSGKSDISAAMYYYTDERSESVYYTDSYYDALTAVVYRKADFEAGEAAPEATSFSFISWLEDGIQKNLITENRWKMIVNGLIVTLQISFLSQIFGTMLGALCAYLLTRKAKPLQYIAKIYSGFIHGTPMVVLLMISYYIIFGKSSISSIIIAVAAFALVEGAGIGEKLRTAISTVDPTEIEAARSMGYSASRAFLRVTLPQAVKVALPGYLNGFVELVKSTAIVGYIAIQDLSRAGDIIRSRTYDAYFPLLFVALIYLIVTTLCVTLFKILIRRLSK